MGEVIIGAFVGDGEGVHLDGEEGDGGDAEVGFGTGGTDLKDFVVRGDKEVVGVAVARGIAVVAEVGAELGIKVIEVGFVFDKDLLNAILERDGADVGVFGIVFFDGSETGADDIAMFYIDGFDLIVGEGIAFYVRGERDGERPEIGEGIGNWGFAVFDEELVELFNFGGEVIPFRGPDGLGKDGRGVDFGLHGLLSFL